MPVVEHAAARLLEKIVQRTAPLVGRLHLLDRRGIGRGREPDLADSLEGRLRNALGAGDAARIPRNRHARAQRGDFKAHFPCDAIEHGGYVGGKRRGKKTRRRWPGVLAAESADESRWLVRDHHMSVAQRDDAFRAAFELGFRPVLAALGDVVEGWGHGGAFGHGECGVYFLLILWDTVRSQSLFRF